MDAKDLVSRIIFEARNDMNQEAYIMTEDEKYLMPFEVFLHNGRLIIKPSEIQFKSMIGIKLEA
jgi:hypothetical protein